MGKRVLHPGDCLDGEFYVVARFPGGGTLLNNGLEIKRTKDLTVTKEECQYFPITNSVFDGLLRHNYIAPKLTELKPGMVLVFMNCNFATLLTVAAIEDGYAFDQDGNYLPTGHVHYALTGCLKKDKKLFSRQGEKRMTERKILRKNEEI